MGATLKEAPGLTLAADLLRAQNLSLEGLRNLQGRLALDPSPADRKAYHQAYVDYLLVAQLKASEPKAAMALLERTLLALEKRLDPESLALRGACLSRKCGLQPFLAPVISIKANSLYDEALRLAPQSPRVRLFQAQHRRGMPAFVGGGEQAALPMFEAAVRAAEAEGEPSDPHAPHWGKVECYAWLAVAQANTGHKALALETVRKALALDPDSKFAHLVEDELLKPGGGR